MINKEINDNYITPQHPTAFTSPGNVIRHNKNLKHKDVHETLNSIDAYTLHREYHKPRIRNPYFIHHKRQQLQMDLIDVSSLKKDNDNVTFLLAAIDVFTKFAWIEPLKRKTAEATLNGIMQIFNQMTQLPETILFDKGKEFTNRRVTMFLQSKNIRVIHPMSEIKAGVAERFNKTIQHRIYRYLTKFETFTFITVLDRLLRGYNNSRHRSLKYMTPTEAEMEANQGKVLTAHHERYAKIIRNRKPPKYKVGQKVLIKSLRTTFQRGYQQTFLKEHFEIIKIETTMPIPMYTIRSLNTGDVITGAFYAEELQPISGDVFKVEKVLKIRKAVDGTEELFVKWQGYNDTHNSWIKASDVTENFENND